MANTETKRQSVIETSLIGPEGQPPEGLKIACPALGQAVHIYLDKLHVDIQTHACVHGLKQKLVDAAAISRDPETGRAATPSTKWAAIMEVYSRITGENPSWNAVREGGGGTLLFKALCRFQPDRDAADIKTWLDSKTDDEKAALRKNPKIAAIIAEIQTENAKTDGIDSDDLLAELQ